MTSFARLLPLLIAFAAGPAFAVDLQGHSLRITGEKDRDFIVPAPTRGGSGQNVLVVRPRDDDDPEVIANGKLVKGNGWRIEIDWEHLKKRPQPGDYVVQLGEPKKFAPPGGGAPQTNTDFTMEKEPEVEPGYIRLGYTQWNAKLTSSNPDTSNLANSLKNIEKYNMTGLELDWFVDFLPNYGLYLAKSSQAVPVRTYARAEVAAQSDRMDIRFQYRNTKVGTKWRWTLALASRSDNFTTENDDHYLLSTTVTALGLSALVAYEPGNPIYTSNSSSIQWLTTGVALIYSPVMTVTDGLVSRGGSGGSTGNELRVFSEWTLYLKWMPYFKRYFLRLEYVTEDAQYKFGGTTRNDGNFYAIPENGVYKEKRQGLMISVGLRFEDFVGKIFKPRN